MPVRIYDIAKKLGIESKEVLAKAKALGITAAKVPSSSLDKITAEYLENELGGVPSVVPAVPIPPTAPEQPVLIVAPPPPPVAELAPPPTTQVEAPTQETPTPLEPAEVSPVAQTDSIEELPVESHTPVGVKAEPGHSQVEGVTPAPVPASSPR